jgi:hypothetical protein
MRRITGVLVRPRSSMTALVATPAFLVYWVVILVIWMACAAWLLSTDVGRQALVDERVRMVEAFGGRVEDAQYAALQASPPAVTYFTSGGRLLLSPPVTLAVALGVMLMARLDGGTGRFTTALAVTVHATVVLAVQQLVSTPLLYARESLASPTSLANILPIFDDGSWPARFFGVIDVFGLWWVWLLAVGVSAMTERPARRYLGRFLAVYVGVALIVAAALAAAGGA